MLVLITDLKPNVHTYSNYSDPIFLRTENEIRYSELKLCFLNQYSLEI